MVARRIGFIHRLSFRMCGICGIVADRSVNLDAIEAMNRVQQHRGPDGAGIWQSPDARVAFGHRRLSILDVSDAGHQPMVSDGLVITFNGEIYNFVELRRTLTSLGHHFVSGSDTEVLLKAYRQWGEGCLERLDGMFAFAVWDEPRRMLFCARDRFGEKPFLFAQGHGWFAFASEAKALATLTGVDLAIEDATLARYFVDGSTSLDSAPQTLFRGIQQLMPAHQLSLSLAEPRLAQPRMHEYWSVPLHDRGETGSVSMNAAAATLRELLTRSVELRLRSDVPVGSCLSGGLDSSAVVSLIRRLNPDGVIRTFTGRFPGHPADEGHYAAMVASASRTMAYEVAPSPERFRSDMASLYWHAELPIGGVSQFAQWCVFHLAKEHNVTVLLDGQGSDEQLGGYGSGIIVAYLRQLAAQRQLARWLRERRAWAATRPQLFSWIRLGLGLPVVAPLRAGLRRIGGRSRSPAHLIANESWLRSSMPDRRTTHEAYEDLPDEHALTRTLYALSFRTMLSGLLRFGDRLSMAHSREVRLPFCSHHIAEFAFALPPELLVGGGDVKQVLRAAIDGIVPPAIVTRPKQGFNPPEGEWLVGPLSETLIERAMDPEAGIGERLNMEGVRRLVTAPLHERRRETPALWHILNLLGWASFSAEPMRSLAKHDPVLS